MSIQKSVEELAIEIARHDFGSIAPPPVGFVGAVMKSDTSELTRIGKDERAITLIKNEMVMLCRAKLCRCDVNFSGHAKMNAEPAPHVFPSANNFGVVAGKFEEHAFAASIGAEVFRAD